MTTQLYRVELKDTNELIMIAPMMIISIAFGLRKEATHRAVREVMSADGFCEMHMSLVGSTSPNASFIVTPVE